MLKNMYFEITIYVITYTLLILFMILLSKKIKNKKIVNIIIILITIIYSSIRYNVGSDYDTYYVQYNNILNYFYSVKQILSLDFQFSFNIILFLTKTYLKSEYAIFLVTSLIIYPLNFYIIRKVSKKYTETIILYFLLGFHLVSLNILKQEIAMIIFLYIYFIFNNKDKKFKISKNILAVILSILMLSFHISSAIPLIIMILSRIIKPTKLKFIISLILSILLAFTYKNIVLSIPLLSRYIRYLYDINYSYYIVIIGAIGYAIFNTIILIMLLKKKNELIKENKLNKYILNSLILNIPLHIIGIINFPLYRLSLYIDQLLLFIIPSLLNIYSSENNERFKKQYLFYFIILIFYNVFSIIFLAHNNFYTYQTIFNK